MRALRQRLLADARPALLLPLLCYSPDMSFCRPPSLLALLGRLVIASRPRAVCPRPARSSCSRRPPRPPRCRTSLAPPTSAVVVLLGPAHGPVRKAGTSGPSPSSSAPSRCEDCALTVAARRAPVGQGSGKGTLSQKVLDTYPDVNLVRPPLRSRVSEARWLTCSRPAGERRRRPAQGDRRGLRVGEEGQGAGRPWRCVPRAPTRPFLAQLTKDSVPSARLCPGRRDAGARPARARAAHGPALDPRRLPADGRAGDHARRCARQAGPRPQPGRQPRRRRRRYPAPDRGCVCRAGLPTSRSVSFH